MPHREGIRRVRVGGGRHGLVDPNQPAQPAQPTKRDLYVEMVLFLRKISRLEYTVPSAVFERGNALFVKAVQREQAKYSQFSAMKDTSSGVVFGEYHPNDCEMSADEDHDHDDDFEYMSYVCETHIDEHELNSEGADLGGDGYTCEVVGCPNSADDRYIYNGGNPLPEWAR